MIPLLTCLLQIVGNVDALLRHGGLDGANCRQDPPNTRQVRSNALLIKHGTEDNEEFRIYCLTCLSSYEYKY